MQSRRGFFFFFSLPLDVYLRLLMQSQRGQTAVVVCDGLEINFFKWKVDWILGVPWDLEAPAFERCLTIIISF